VSSQTNIDDQAIVIRVKNVAGLVESKGGKTGAFAYQLVPQTISRKVYNEMAAKLKSGFKDQGVDADISVVATAPSVKRSMPDIYVGMALGAGVIGIGWLLSKYVFKGFGSYLGSL
jgi:hypothetical protein